MRKDDADLLFGGIFCTDHRFTAGGSKCDKELDDIQQEKFLKEWNQKHGKKKKN